MGRLGEALLFFANDGVHGCELWKTDGTEAGTMLVRDVRPGSDSAIPSDPYSYQPPITIVVAGNLAYFAADDGTNGTELWVSDGTEAGTRLVKDAQPGGSSSPTGIVAQGSLVYFRGLNAQTGGVDLWRSDGTTAGTFVVRDLSANSYGNGVVEIKVAGSHVFFTATTAAEGLGLWHTDGTSAGTTFLTSLNSSYPHSWAAIGNRVIFSKFETGYEQQPWISDGTLGGTHRIFAAPTQESILYRILGNAGGKVVYATGQYSGQLWATDGTPQGTVPLGLTVSSDQAVAAGSKLYVGDYVLAVTDGTPVGTRQVLDNSLGGLIGGSPTFYFISADSYGAGNLWMTTGTPASSMQVAGAADYQFRASPTDAASRFTAKGMLIFVAQGETLAWEPYLIPFDGIPSVDFAEATNVLTNSVVVSPPAQVTDINVPVDVAATNGDFCISSAASCSCDLQSYAATGSVQSGQFLCARHTSSSLASTTVSTQLTIGNVLRQFSSTTRALNPPTVGFTASAARVDEDGSVSLTISRAGDGGAVTATWNTQNGSAVAGVHYGIPGNAGGYSGVLSWPDGDFSSRSIVIGGPGATVPLIDDSEFRATETTFSLALQPLTAGAVASPGTIRVTVADDDSVFLFSYSLQTVYEDTYDTWLPVQRYGRVDRTASVAWSTENGTAVAGSDFGTPGSITPPGGTLVFEPNETFKYIRVGRMQGANIPIIADGIPEVDESFIVKLSSPVEGYLGSPSSMAVLIASTDASIGLASTASTVAESAGVVEMLVVRSGPYIGTAASVQYSTIAGTAVAGVDFTPVSGTLTWASFDTSPKKIVIPIIDNAAPNGARSFQLNLSNPVGSMIVVPTAEIRITDDDTYIQMAAATAVVTEGAPNLALTVTRSSTSVPMSVKWKAEAGTAIPGIDYGGPFEGTLSWAAAEAGTRQIVIPILNDAIPEPAKTFKVSLSEPVGAKLGGTNATVITLLDDDAGVAFSTTEYVVAETSGVASLRIDRIGPTKVAASVRWTAFNGTASAGSDYGVKGSNTPSTGTVSWLAGDMKPKTIAIPILQDRESEGDEAFSVVLSNPSTGIKLGTPSMATVRIMDDDPPVHTVISFTQPKFVVVEGQVRARVYLKRESPTGDFSQYLTVWTEAVADTARQNIDFWQGGSSVAWFPGDRADKYVEFEVIDDAVAESPKSFKVLLAPQTAGVKIGTPEALVTILDDDDHFPPAGAMPGDFVIPSSATKGWHVSGDSGAYEGLLSLRSDSIDDGEVAALEVTRAFGAGSMTFRLKVSSEPNFDKLRFFVDGVERGAWSGTSVAGWQLFSTPITAGVHTLRWSYEKDGSASIGADAAWIDALTLP